MSYEEQHILEILERWRKKTASFQRMAGYSVRRYWVDEFFLTETANLPPGCRVLDLGGTSNAKRGFFRLDRSDLEVFVANISSMKGADLCADAAYLPLEDESFDALICSELLEHVEEPQAVMREAFRVLRPGGRFLLTAPFLFPIHPDPLDFGRYTDTYWRMKLQSTGFREVVVTPQGALLSVLAEITRAWWAGPLARSRCKGATVLRRIFFPAIVYLRQLAFRRDRVVGRTRDEFFSRYTTGFGVTARK